MIKQLAADADERWKSAPRYIDSPDRQQPAPSAAINETEGPTKEQSEVKDVAGVKSGVEDQQEMSKEDGQQPEQAKGKRQREENPFNQPQTGAPSQKWQPESWTPGVAQRR